MGFEFHRTSEARGRSTAAALSPVVALLTAIPCLLAAQRTSSLLHEVELQSRRALAGGVTNLGRSLAVTAHHGDDSRVMLAAGAKLDQRAAVLVFDAKLRAFSRSLELESDGASFGAALEWNGDALIIGAPEARGGVGRVLVVAGDANSAATEITEFAEARDFGRVIRASDESDDPKQREILIGAPLASDGEWKQCGAVAAYDATTLALRWIAHGEKDGDEFGSAIEELDDVDGDGAPDFAIAAAGSASIRERSSRGRVILVSGATGREIRGLRAPSDRCEGFGSSLACIHDLDGDGYRDLAIGAPRANSGVYASGVVELLSTSTGKELGRIIPSCSVEPFHDKNVCFGWQVVPIEKPMRSSHGSLLVSAPDGFYNGCDCGYFETFAIDSCCSTSFETWNESGFRPMRCGATIRRTNDRSAPFDVIAIGTNDNNMYGGIHVSAPGHSSDVDWEFFGRDLK